MVEECRVGVPDSVRSMCKGQEARADVRELQSVQEQRGEQLRWEQGEEAR